MKTYQSLLAASMLLATSIQASILSLKWDVPSTSGNFSLSVNTEILKGQWNTSDLWVSPNVVGDDIIFVPQTILGDGTIVSNVELVTPYIKWNDGTSNLLEFLFFDPLITRFTCPLDPITKSLTFTEDQVNQLKASSVFVTLNPEMEDTDFHGVLMVIPEPPYTGIIIGCFLGVLAVFIIYTDVINENKP